MYINDHTKGIEPLCTTVTNLISMKKLKLVGLLFFITLLSAQVSYGQQNKQELRNELTMKLVLQFLNQAHYNPQQINDEFSEKVHSQYIRRIDPTKRFLLSEDIKAFEKYKAYLDDEINAGSFEFFDYSFNTMTARVGEAKAVFQEIISQPFDYSKKEYVDFDYDVLTFAKNEQERRESWRKYLKFYALRNLHDLQKQQKDTKLNTESELNQKTFEELEAEAREKVKKNFEQYFKRLEEIEKRDRISDYINAFTSIYDPHTTYYAPKDKEDFDIEFSGRLEGIGARLVDRDGYITVSSIVAGSACWRQGDLEVNDAILKVAQADEDPVDVVGMRIDDAVQLIRGKKGTEVRLTVRKIDGTMMVIPIIRDVVIFEQTYARSVVVESDNKFGYVKLPSFYADFSGSGGRRCAEDVRQEIIKLKGENIEGLILDLRNNGGGSLADVVEMAGLFIEKGPIVQVKSRLGNPQVLEDRDDGVLYDGPLVVLVNSQSASASEILAAAIQDYGRGVIIGSTSTFGKGTVQRIFNLDEQLRPGYYEEIKPFGSILLTTQKFYRIDGTTNQLKGVRPDIVLPDNYTYIDYGEKDLKYPIPWDEIDAANFEKWNEKLNKIDAAKKQATVRVQGNNKFNLIDKNARRLKERSDNQRYPLNYTEYETQQLKLRNESKKLDLVRQEIDGIEISSLQADLPGLESDSTKMARMDALHKSLKKDIYVNEAVAVLKDLEQ